MGSTTVRKTPRGCQLLGFSAALLLVSWCVQGLLADGPGTTPAEKAPTPAPKVQPAPAPSQPSTPVSGAETPKGVATKKNFAPQAPPATFSPPVCDLEQPDFDWGSVLQGEVVRHDYKIVNKGGAPLQVLQVKPSCGCTTAAKPEKPIEPGQTGVVTLEVDTKKFNGSIKKTADVTTNAASAAIKLSMSGKVEPFFTIEPQSPKIDIVRGVPVEPVKITLKRSAKAELKVKEVKAEGKVLTTTWKEVQPGEVYEIAATADLKDNPGKYYSEQVQVKLDAGGKEFSIPVLVSVSVKDRIDVQPRTSVYFSRNETKQLKDQPGTPISKQLDIKSLAGADHTFKVTDVKFENQAPNFETKLETVTEGKHYRLNVLMSKLPADQKSRTVRDTIVVTVDDPTVKELKITALAALQ